MTPKRIAELRAIAEVLERRSETFGKIGPSLTDCLDEIESLQSRVQELEKALRSIENYPVHSEPVGGAYAMQDIAHAAMKGTSEKDSTQ